MTYEVLARKWRPQVFQDVIGQEHVTQTLMNAIKTDRLAHAYLFGGPRGVGKTSVARILAKAINCEKGEPGVPCNKCQSCLEITNGSSVDVQEIDGASNRRIEEVRELRQNIKYMPSSSKYRIYIIDEVHMLTKEAFNALLKTLEEPPAHAKFIFATTETQKVPVTILSRCQRFEFKRIPPVQIAGQLDEIAKKEDIEISKSGLGIIARKAEGSMRDAESLLDQVVSFAGKKIDDKQVTEILGVIDTDIIFNASRAIIEGSPKDCIQVVDQIYNYGYDIKEFYRALMDHIRNLLISLIDPHNHLLDMSETGKKEARKQAEKAGLEKLQVLLNFLVRREADLRFTSHPRLILETTMIKLCNLGDFLSFGDLLEKMELLEKRLVTTLAVQKDQNTDYVSDPGVQWVSKDTGEVQKKTGEVNPSYQTWDDFLTFLSSKSKAMFNILKDWQVLRLTEEEFEITKGNQSFSSSFFDDQERYDQLSGYCRDFFKRNIKIKIVSNNTSPALKKKSSRTERKRPGAAKYSDIPPPVQDILQVFQGEIKGGHSSKEEGSSGLKEEKKKAKEVQI